MLFPLSVSERQEEPVSFRRSFHPVFPALHYIIVELILVALTLRGAWEFFSWLLTG